MQKGREVDVGQYRIEREPFYAEVRGEIGLFTIAANKARDLIRANYKEVGYWTFTDFIWKAVEAENTRLRPACLAI